jgi:RNA polymerase sigma factor (sigma-70 family)
MQLPPNLTTTQTASEHDQLPECFWRVWNAIEAEHGERLAKVLKDRPQAPAPEEPSKEKPPESEFWRTLEIVQKQHGERIRQMVRPRARRLRIDSSVAQRSAEGDVARALLRHKLSAGSPPWTLLCTIVRRKLRDHAVRARARKRDVRRECGDEALAGRPDSRAVRPEDQAAMSELLAKLLAFLEESTSQAILVLWWARFAKEEIGKVLGCSQYQIRVVLKASRQWCNRSGLNDRGA